MRGIRFKPEMIKWIQERIKTTTFRKTRRTGLYQIVKGSWFKPQGLGLYIICKPIMRITKYRLLRSHFESEGDFKTPGEFITWLRINKLLGKLPYRGWLMEVNYVGDEKVLKKLKDLGISIVGIK